MNDISDAVETVSFADPHGRSRAEEVLLFEFSLEGPSSTTFDSVLHPEELEAAARRRSSELRERFISARGALRIVLGSIVDRAAASLIFLRGPQGKPYLEGGPAFNLSHSEDIAILAVSTVPGMDSASLGVDVEHVRSWPDLNELAQRVFTPEERAWLQAHAAGDRQAAFFRLWTAKESYMKATGEGLACPLQDFRVAWFEDEMRGQIIAVPNDTDLGYRIIDLPQGPGRVASLCLAEAWKEIPIRRFRLQ